LISYNVHKVYNSGHPNIDNRGVLFSGGKDFQHISSKFVLSYKWLYMQIQPYQNKTNDIYSINNDTLSSKLTDPYFATFRKNNNFSYQSKSSFGLKNSFILLHYKGLGLAYGKMNHWWGPGFHSAIALSSNSPSQETIAIGTFKDLSFKGISTSTKIIAMPYSNTLNNKIYLTGLRSYLRFNYNPNITVGINRTFLSGEFNKNVSNWSIYDATSLVLESLFSQNKRNLPYTDKNTPGFDSWDQLLTGFIEVEFPKDRFKVYVDIASDDNRANLTDLKAHWDHTLGYQIGLTKQHKYNEKDLFFGFEHLSLRTSNTFNPKFYRGNPNAVSFYTKTNYDYFSYEGRRMGAHSGSSSDDMIVIFGFKNADQMFYISLNEERNGIKTMEYPQLKSELVASYQRKIHSEQKLSFTLEYEVINNFGYIANNKSKSMLFWLSYEYLFTIK
tara:strand:- start:56 stop:1384 length:1329 start_codon:yes stop_codon:yes gene_type:complete